MINWSKAPKNAQWWAVDENGDAHWFLMPDVKPFTNFWYADMTPAPNFEFEDDWRESLTVLQQNDKCSIGASGLICVR